MSRRPAVPLPAARSIGGRAQARRRSDRGRSSRPGCAATRCSSTLFLYLPIVVVVVFSFNGTARRVTALGRLQPPLVRVRRSTNKEVQRYLLNSLIVGLATAIISTIIGTMAALGLQRARAVVPPRRSMR